MDKKLFTGIHVASRATRKRVVKQPDDVAEAGSSPACAPVLVAGHLATDCALGPAKPMSASLLCGSYSPHCCHLRKAAYERRARFGFQYEGRGHGRGEVYWQEWIQEAAAGA